jgi:hypothetical protein
VTTEDRQIVLTESTKIRLTIAQAIMVIGVLVSVISAGAIAWYAEKTAREAHEANIYVHLDPKFTTEHGTPVGKWDLAPGDAATATALKALQDQADYSKRRVDAIEAEVQNRKPRWRP